MAFWGIEVKPGSPYIYQSDESGRLHVSQATLGDGSSKKKTMVQCQVGSKKPIYLCSLLPKKLENCALNLEFEEDDQVTFSVIGPQSVHLSGFFYGDNEDPQDDDCCGYGSDPCEEDVMGTDSEEEDDYIDYDSEDEDESDEYSDDGFVYPPSPAANSGVRIEEIVDDEKPVNEDDSKKAKKQKTQSRVSDGNENSDRQIVLKAGISGNGAPLLESEDEDGFPISGNKTGSSNSEPRLEETADEIVGEKTQKSKEIDGVACGKKSKEKIDADREGNVTSENAEPNGSSIQPDIVISGSEVKQKKKNKKRKAAEESAQANGMQSPNSIEEPPVPEIENDPKPSAEKKKEKKKKKKQKKGEENMPTPNAEEKQTEKKLSMVLEQDKKEAKSLQVRTFSNGLVIEELTMGKPDGKKASPGKKVSVHYIGKLKKNGKIFDSNIGRAPFKFRLGIGQVIKGWDVGVNGMRIGDKRRLTIPPSMGYGAKGVAAIPPNSWLVFDVELVDVN